MEIGFIGLGNMGGPMSRRLVEAGHKLTVFDTSKDALDRLVALGAQAATSPKDIADQLEHWFAEKAADGFNLLPPHVPGALNEFVDLVVPELQRRGLFRTEYEGAMLRQNLGVPYPQ